MKKAASPRKPAPRQCKPAGDDLRPEYRLDYSTAKPNRFTSQAGTGSVVVVLDDDIAEVFRTPEEVKTVLRALIRSMPRPRSGKRKQAATR